MKVMPHIVGGEEGISRLVRLWYEPSRDKYILAYSDEMEPRVADPDEVGELADRAIRHEKAPAGALAAPLVAQIAVTSECNLACQFCYAELKAQKTPSMTTAEVRRVIEMLYQKGVIFLEWAGGEPLLQPDFVDLLAYAHSLDFKQSVLTNGTRFTREFLACAASCLKTVQVSVDDVGEHYNELKGGAYWETLGENLGLALAAGLPLVASIVLSDRNVARLEAIIDYIWKRGIPVARVSWQVPMGEAKDTALEAYRHLAEGTSRRIRSLQRQYKARGLSILALQERPMLSTLEFLPREFLLCSAGRSRFYIDWNGDAYPCPVLKYPELCAGNILDRGFEEIWFSPVWERLRSITNGPQCKRCKVFCSYWCRALVYGFTGDISLTPSPLCPRQGGRKNGGSP